VNPSTVQLAYRNKKSGHDKHWPYSIATASLTVSSVYTVIHTKQSD